MVGFLCGRKYMSELLGEAKRRAAEKMSVEDDKKKKALAEKKLTDQIPGIVDRMRKRLALELQSTFEPVFSKLRKDGFSVESEFVSEERQGQSGDGEFGYEVEHYTYDFEFLKISFTHPEYGDFVLEVTIRPYITRAYGDLRSPDIYEIQQKRMWQIQIGSVWSEANKSKFTLRKILKEEIVSMIEKRIS